MYKNYREHHFDRNAKDINYSMRIITLAMWIFAVGLMIYAIVSTNKRDDNNDKSLKIENARLLNQIENLLDSNTIIMNDLVDMQTEFSQLNIDNAELNTKIKDQKNIIQSLKVKYEKANHFSNNYDADSIRVYFSNIEK